MLDLDKQIKETTVRIQQLEDLLLTIPFHDIVYRRDIQATYDQVLRDLTRLQMEKNKNAS